MLTIYRPVPADFPAIADLWEASVRATHTFLPESDILYFKLLILNEYLYQVDLYCTKDGNGSITGFLGVADGKIEMLFIDPAVRGQGIGRFLSEYAIKELKATTVDVNEQNEQAVGFYQKMGFKTTGRSPLDGLGKPYPLLHMEL